MSGATEWITAVGTAGAFVTASVVYATDRSRRRLDAQASQARLFDAWIESARWMPDEDVDNWDGEPNYSSDIDVSIRLSNGSAQAFRTTDVYVLRGDISSGPSRAASSRQPHWSNTTCPGV